MEQTYETIKEAIAYYVARADRLSLPEDYSMAEEIADKIWHLEETLDILKGLYNDNNI